MTRDEQNAVLNAADLIRVERGTIEAIDRAPLFLPGIHPEAVPAIMAAARQAAIDRLALMPFPMPPFPK